MNSTGDLVIEGLEFMLWGGVEFGAQRPFERFVQEKSARALAKRNRRAHAD